MADDRDEERIVISSEDLDSPPPPPPAQGLPPVGAPKPLPPAPVAPVGPGPVGVPPVSWLSRLGRNTIISGLVAGLLGGAVGMVLAETVADAGGSDGSASDAGGSGIADDGSFYNGIELGTGDVQFTLIWHSTADLDLHVIDPEGEEIYFGATRSASGGELDVDSNPGCSSTTSSPVENVFWPSGDSPSGRYEVRVHYFSECAGGSGPQEYEVIGRVDGDEVENTTGTLDAAGDDATVLELER